MDTLRLLSRIAATLPVVALSWASPAAAWDGIKTGKVSGIDVVTEGQNFGFRVYMDGAPMCGTSEAWAFVNRDADNYDAIVSVITSAYLSGKVVTLLTNQSGIYCRIGYVQLR